MEEGGFASSISAVDLDIGCKYSHSTKTLDDRDSKHEQGNIHLLKRLLAVLEPHCHHDLVCKDKVRGQIMIDFLAAQDQ